MSLLIYSIHNCIDKVSIANFEYFISYGLLNNNSIKPNKPITTLIVFVNNTTQFNNQFKLDNLSIQLIILETKLVNSIDIIQRFYKYIANNNTLFKENITNIFYVNSNLIGPILGPREINSHWTDILINKSNNIMRGIKHFSQNMFIFDFIYFKNRINELKKVPNLDIYFFRKNTMPINFNYELYKTYLNIHDKEYNYNTNLQLMYHYLKINTKLYDNIIINRICIIYIYYEVKNKQQNQNNLAFFIKYGLDQSRWRDMNITTLFIINSPQCEVLLPQMNNVHILYNTNVHDDEKSYKIGIDYFTNKYNTTICNLFTHICLINVNTFGPTYADSNMSHHWLDPLLKDSSISATSTISNNVAIIDCNKSHIFGNYNDDFLKFKLNYKEGIFDISNYTDFFNKTNNKCIIYAHYDKDNIIKQYVLKTLAIFAQLGYDILFYTTSSIINNYDKEYLPFKINYFDLNHGSGTDWYMWLAGCNQLKLQLNKYDWITLINDSMLIGINGIENMKETIHEMENKDVDFWGHWDSTEINYHIMSSFFVLKYNVIDSFIVFCKQFLIPCKTRKDIILYCETKFTQYLKEAGFKTAVVIEETSLPNVNVHTPSHHPFNIEHWINNKKAFGIKWKYVLPYLAEKPLNNEFKEMLQLIYIGNCVGINNIFRV
jgi:hypothetical protein